MLLTRKHYFLFPRLQKKAPSLPIRYLQVSEQSPLIFSKVLVSFWYPINRQKLLVFIQISMIFLTIFVIKFTMNEVIH
jgi:hypothetical protein